MQKAHDELEVQVEERTAEIVKVNEALKQKIVELEQVQEALKESEKTYRHSFDWSLAKDIMEKHHGDIDIQSEVGKGTIVSLRILYSVQCKTY